jgi:hypothetical protein
MAVALYIEIRLDEHKGINVLDTLLIEAHQAVTSADLARPELGCEETVRERFNDGCNKEGDFGGEDKEDDVESEDEKLRENIPTPQTPKSH